MAKYHLNPKTGNPNVCRAKHRCPFGDLERDHYGTPEAARLAYEAGRGSFSGVKEYPFELPLDGETLILLDALSEGEVRPHVVGGAVRDALDTGLVSKDVDIEVYGLSSLEELDALARRKGYITDPVGSSFGVLKTKLPNGRDIDLSLPRRDSLVGEGHRGFEVEVDPTLSLEEAAARRDFTINALYYDHKRRVVLDAHGGMEDWQARRLRHVSDAFSEDPLRVLRAVQFASRFDLTLAPETAELARSISDSYPTLSTERVQEEWQKLFAKGRSVRRGLETLQATGWDRHFGLDRVDIAQASEDAEWSMARAREVGLPPEVYGPAAISMHLPDEERLSFLKHTVVGDRPANQMVRLALVEEPGSYAHRELNRWARNELKDAGSVREWTTLHGHFIPPGVEEHIRLHSQAAGCWERPRPDLVTGQMILEETGEKKGGPWVGQIMRTAAEAQDWERFRDSAGARDWLRGQLANFSVGGR